MARYVLRDGKLVLSHLAPRPPVARSHLPCPAIRPDGMTPLQSMATGKMHDSKSALYAEYCAHGCEIVDSPSDYGPAQSFEPSGVAADLKRACEEHGL